MSPVEAHYYAMWATFLLIFTRFIGFFVQSAVWGSHHPPHQVLVGAGLAFSFLVYPNVHPPALFEHWKTHQGHPLDLMMFVVLIAQQFCVGLILGNTTYMALAISEFAGELFDIQMGLSSAASFDPSSHGAKNLLNRLTFYVGLTLYLMCDGHMLSLEAMKRSFEVIPLDCFTMSRPLLELLWHRMGDMFSLGLEMAAPVVAALFIVQVALGMVARVAPQMNVFMLSFPMNIGIGLTLLCTAWPFIERRFYEMFHQDWVLMLKCIVLMGPHTGR